MFGWFMAGGAKVVGVLFGALGFGLLFVSTLTLGFERWELHKNELRNEGRRIVTVEFLEAQKASAREKADAEKQRAIEVLNATTETVGDLQNAYDNLSAEYAALAATANANPTDDPDRCISSGVLLKLRGNRKMEGGGNATSSGKPNS